MGLCVFKTARVKRCVEHALSSARWDMGYSEAPPQPALFFVHDQGVYLMSNGNPRDLITGAKSPSAYTAFASNCDPSKDEDWWDASRDLVGGDDFAETILIDHNWLTNCAEFEELHIAVTSTQLESYFAKPVKKRVTTP